MVSAVRAAEQRIAGELSQLLSIGVSVGIFRYVNSRFPDASDRVLLHLVDTLQIGDWFVMKRAYSNIRILWLLLALIAGPRPVNAQAYNAEQIRKEGEVVLYSTITVAAFNELQKAMKEKYPVLNVRHIRLGPAQQLARYLQEQRAGQTGADVIYNNLLHVIYLKENGMLARYESPENQFLLKAAIL